MVDKLLTDISEASGFALPNYFDVSIPGKLIRQERHSHMVLSCTVPSREIQTGEYNPGAPTRKYAYGVQDEDISIVYRLTNDFELYDIYMDWVEQVANPQTFTKQYKIQVAHDTYIVMLDREHKPTKTFRLVNSFPINISNIELSNESENQIATFGVTLTYDYFLRM